MSRTDGEQPSANPPYGVRPEDLSVRAVAACQAAWRRRGDVPITATRGPFRTANDYSRPRRAATRRSGTFQIASRTIARDIFEPPASRSTNVIGTSATLKPARNARYVVSIWNAYPFEWIASRSIVSRTRRRKHLKPHVRSRTRLPRKRRA